MVTALVIVCGDEVRDYIATLASGRAADSCLQAHHTALLTATARLRLLSAVLSVGWARLTRPLSLSMGRRPHPLPTRIDLSSLTTPTRSFKQIDCKLVHQATHLHERREFIK